MSEQVTVKKVGEGRPWQHGITYWEVTFDRAGNEFECVWGKKGDEPQAGESIEGEFFQKDGEWRFRKGSKDFDGKGQSALPSAQGTEPRKGWQPESERDPERAARILRQHSQEMAIRALGLYGKVDESESNLRVILKEWTDHFDQDVNEAGQAAIAAQTEQAEGRQVSEGAAQQSPPAIDQSDFKDVDGLDEQHPPDLTDLKRQDTEMALWDAGAAELSTESIEKVATYMLTKLSQEDYDRACNQLTNGGEPNTQQRTFLAMKKRTEKDLGEELAKGKDGEIPFRRPEYREPFSERMRWRF